MRSVFLLSLIFCSCVPYQNQLIERQTKIDEDYSTFVKKASPNQLIFNGVLYQNQVEFEQTSIANGNEITLRRLLPNKDSEEILKMNIIDDHLLIPINTYREVHDQSEYILLFDENYSMDEYSQVHVNLILKESRPEKIVWRNTREMKYLKPRFYSFNLSSLKKTSTNKIIIHLFGQDKPFEYSYSH